MIIEFFLNSVASVLKLIFGILPSLPPMPEWITDFTVLISDFIIGGIFFVSYLLTPQLLIFLITTLVVITQFDIIYHGVLWVLRKLPISSH